MKTRRTLKNSTLCPIQRLKHKAMRNGVEEHKEWRRWRYILIDKNLDYVFKVVPYSSSDLLPCPSDNSNCPLMMSFFSFNAGSSNYLSS
jgi:hypothetical protein